MDFNRWTKAQLIEEIKSLGERLGGLKSERTASEQNSITVSGILLEWEPKRGLVTFAKLPVAMMWIDTTLMGLMSGVQSMVGTKRFCLALQSEGRRSVEADWEVISRLPDFTEGFAAIANIAAVAGWGRWELVSFDHREQRCQFRIRDSWEGTYQKALGVCWESAMLAGKLAGYCTKLFGTNCWAAQTAFIARGDEYDEFVVEPSDRSLEEEIEKLLESDEATRADMAVTLEKLRREVEERTKTERALKDSEKRMELALRGASLGTWDWDVRSGSATFNERWAEMLGYELPEIDPHVSTWKKMLHPDDRAEVEAALSAHMEGNIDYYETEHRLRHKSGEWIWVLDRGQVIERDADGRPIRAAGTHLDITERKRIEERQRETLEQYRVLSDLPSEGILIHDRGTILDANKALGNILGIPSRDLIGKNGFEIIPFTAESKQKLQDHMRSGSEESYEVELMVGGSKVFAETSGKSIAYLGREARIVRMRDITKEKEGLQSLIEQEQRVRESEAQLSNALKMANAGHWEYDVDRDLFTFNDNFYRIFKTTAEKVGGYQMSAADYAQRFLHPDDVHVVAEEIQAARETRDPNHSRRMEHRILYADGEVGHIAVRYFVEKDEHGRTVRTFGVNQDITDRIRVSEEKVRLQNQLQQAMKMEAIGRLAGGVAHDFNNILTAISGYAELILEALEPGDPLRVEMEEIQSAGKRASELTAQLLAFSRKQVVSPKVVQPNEIFEQSQNMLRRIIGEDINLVFAPDVNLGRIKIDPTQLEQILVNLAINARDAMPDGGHLTIETKNVSFDSESVIDSHIDAEPGDYVMLAVTDSGFGMDEETQARVFEPFFSTKDRGKGTGLGLATVYGIVKQNNGTISVHSELNVGTMFKVYFPRVTEELDAVRKDKTSEIPVGTETVLLVEDEDMVRGLAKRILERRGYNVIEMDNGGKAFVYCSEHDEQIDLLFTDVVMPGINGWDLYNQLRKKRPSLKAVFMSGYMENVTVHHGVLDEGVHFIQKPFTIEELTVTVRKALDGEA